MPPSTNRPIYGKRAADAVFKKRPQDIRKVYLLESSVKYFSPLLKYCSSKKLPYKIVGEDELGKIAKSTHNEGVCLITKERPLFLFADFMRIDVPRLTESKQRHVILYLDGVENPHNLGSLIRIASFFGVRFIVSRPAESFRLSGAACRIAEGGGEFVELVSSEEPEKDLASLEKKGFHLLATSANVKLSIFELAPKLPTHLVLLIGSERRGVSKELLKLANSVATIPGASEINSLNVATATGIFLAELVDNRQKA
jgi:TrmH RNA methyltransferase